MSGEMLSDETPDREKQIGEKQTKVDDLIERRRLRRSLTVWRAVGAVLVSAILVIFLARSDDGAGSSIISPDHVARVYVGGIIISDRWRADLLDELKNDDGVKAVMVMIDSPGGTVVGGEELFLGLKELAETKPVVAVMGSTATSAAYMTALGTDYLIAREGSVTGSIGVLMETADFTAMLEKLGIKPEIIKSSPLKAQPNPLETITPEARMAMKDVILDMFSMFTDMVASRRHMTPEQVSQIADGRIFTGRQALKNGLIDAIGGEKEARAWLAENREIPLEIPAKDAKPDYPKEQWYQKIMGLAGKTLFSERLKLDGLLSVWHPNM
ncbi:MAG: signal peptide peptidase SppA [Rhodospirillaceae bacterium]|nr:signal peptide peptidase SppA [Rhodospirillaceae bacterium]